MTGEMVEFAGNGKRVPGYLALPDGEGPFPAIVVIQEWWGLNDHIKDVARRFAEEGFVALAPDLYLGQIATEPDEARKLAMELEHPQAIKYIQGAINYLVEMDQTAPKQVGLVGFCMGGGLTALMSHKGERIGAAVVFYGNVRDLAQAEVASQVSAPLMGNFGETDQGIPPDVVKAAEEALKAEGKVVDFHIFPGAAHAFFNDSRPHIYHEEASKQAWARTLAWFRQYLV